MDKLVGKVALVTGASSGIGEAISKQLVESGVKVIGCARDIQRIEVLANSLKETSGSLTAVKCDVSKEGEVLAMFNQIKTQFDKLDICVCNAGISYNAPILTGKTEDWREMFDVNVFGMLLCCREGVKSMQHKGVDDGHIIVICGESGHRLLPIPNLHVYCAAKQSVRTITDGLRRELSEKKSHIRVTTISPGQTETKFLYRRYPDNPEIARKLYSSKQPLQAEDIAEATLYCLTAPVRAQVEEILVTPTTARF